MTLTIWIMQIYSVFPADNDEDTSSLQKFRKKDGQWNVEKEALGWVFQGEETSMVLEERKV